MADWIQAGWNRSLEVHLEEVNDCYVSANITGSTYSGGAHPYEEFSTFNWNVRAKRALQNDDLFRTDTEWKSEILALYRQRLQASGADLSEGALSSDGMKSLFTDGFVITDNGLRFVAHEGATRNDNVPAIDFSWHELAPLLVPGAICSIPTSDRLGEPCQGRSVMARFPGETAIRFPLPPRCADNLIPSAYGKLRAAAYRPLFHQTDQWRMTGRCHRHGSVMKKCCHFYFDQGRHRSESRKLHESTSRTRCAEWLPDVLWRYDRH
jgi:hypothetical protein